MINIYVSSLSLELLLKYKNIFPDSEVNVLLSYGTISGDYYDMLFTYRHLINSLILDSGTFTRKFSGASSAGKVEFDGFLAYCLTFKDQFDMIFNYDEDFAPTGYNTNLRYLNELIKNGINAVPVVHDYPGQEVDKYIDAGFDTISLGYAKEGHKKGYYHECVEKIKMAGKKVHLLGISTYDALFDVHADYCDSSNYAQAVKYGYIYYWDESIEHHDKSIELHFLDFTDEKQDKTNFEDFERRDDVEHYLENTLGISYIDLYGHRKHFYRMLVNLDYYVNLQDRVREQHKRRSWE